jgi:tetratricopeptide (TPR) repeat protein
MRPHVTAPVLTAALSLFIPYAFGVVLVAQDGLPPAVLVDTAKMDASTVELLTELAEAVRKDPSNGTAHADLGLAYEANTIWALAERQYDNAVKLLPDKPEWLYRRGLVRSYNGDLDGAARDLGEAAQRLRNTAVVQARYADVLRTLGRLEEAKAAWTQAIASELNQPQGVQWAASRVGLAQTLLDLGEFERALELTAEALALTPTSKHAHYTRGLALRELGRDEEAKDELVRGLDAYPEFPTDPHWQRLADYGRGYSRRMMGIENQMQAGDLAGATTALQAMLAERPDDHFVLNLAARASMLGGDLAGAKFLLDKSLAANASSPNTYIEYTIVLLNEMAQVQQQAAMLGDQPGGPEAQKRLQELDTDARTKISRALELTPQLGRAHYYAGLVQLQTAGQDQQKLQGAMQSLTNALRLGCTEPRFYQHLAQVYALTGRPREMVKYAELAVANAPDNVDALMFLVQAYASGGRQADLGWVAKRLVAAGPQNPEALRMAILAYNTVNDLDGAEQAAGLLVPLAVDRPDLAQFLEQVRAHITEQRAAREAGGVTPPPAPEKGGGGQ